jgi:hypothetical protein
MNQLIIYASDSAFHGRLAIQTVREHLCGFYQQSVTCAESGTELDSDTGHTVCCGCGRITVESGLRRCDICEREYINKDAYQDPNYETDCEECVIKYGL